ncbi:MAG: metallophosphoesterase family protein [Thermoanaerobaculia bacterium]|nr:metallophosphoesterase family protein [Thermoanaerobaculia bacterium]
MSRRPPEDQEEKEHRGDRRRSARFREGVEAREGGASSDSGSSGDGRGAERKESARQKLTAHRGKATWGERLVPLGRFRKAVARAGRSLSNEERAAERKRFLASPDDPTPVEGPFRRILAFGGVYNNHRALAALLETADRRGADAVYCLGDLGGFGPNPEKVRPLLGQGDVRVSQGNYEQSLARGHDDCNCGYTDPRDNEFARISYRYTAERCSGEFREWMGALPERRRVRVGERELLLVHGSPRRVNEFLFESTTPDPFLETLLDQEGADGLLFTHTGLHWHRRLPSGRDAVNVGVIGRPANDGDTRVWYSWLEDRDGELAVELSPLEYDHASLAEEMRAEDLPEEFVETIETGWWTTCLEILPAKERARSRF